MPSAARPALLALALSAAAAGSADAQARDPDPYEGFNRRTFAIFQSVDRHVLRPAAMAWRRVLPSPIRSGLRNALSNLGEPVVFFNDVLQVRPTDASVSFGRFAINSTAGVAGLFDVAKRGGLPHHDNGFGVTLGRAGVGPGPYVYLIGPSTTRDLVGQGVDILLNPLTWIGYGARTEAGISQNVSGALNARADADADLQALRAQATDEYATLRSLYLQNRQAQITGRPVDVDALPSFDDPAAPAGPAGRGSVSPTGAAPRKGQGPGVPTGDAAALPKPVGPDSASPPPSGPRDDAPDAD